MRLATKRSTMLSGETATPARGLVRNTVQGRSLDATSITDPTLSPLSASARRALTRSKPARSGTGRNAGAGGGGGGCTTTGGGTTTGGATTTAGGTTSTRGGAAGGGC